MAQLPLRLPQDQQATQWKSLIDPLLSNRLTQGFLISDIKLLNGENTINHLLSRKMTGWYMTDVNAAAVIYRSQPLNDKTLTLNSNAVCVISLWVF